MLVKLWGTRGSIPSPGERTARFGGNTPCVSMDAGSGGHHLLLDAGTGIRKLGRELVAHNDGATEVDILLSHTHWDHIQGLPFFAPLFMDGSRVRICGARQGNTGLDEVLKQLMSPVVFPVPLEGLAADLAVEHVDEGEFELGDFTVATMRVRHPGHTLGMRIGASGSGSKLVYVTDNELGPGGDYDVAPDWRERFVKFVAGSDLLIHDAMYTPEQVASHPGWGHSSWEEAVALALEAGVKRLVLFHHNPEHCDDDLDEILDRARDMAAVESGLDVVAGYEGMELKV